MPSQEIEQRVESKFAEARNSIAEKFSEHNTTTSFAGLTLKQGFNVEDQLDIMTLMKEIEEYYRQELRRDPPDQQAIRALDTSLKSLVDMSSDPQNFKKNAANISNDLLNLATTKKYQPMLDATYRQKKTFENMTFHEGNGKKIEGLTAGEYFSKSYDDTKWGGSKKPDTAEVAAIKAKKAKKEAGTNETGSTTGALPDSEKSNPDNKSTRRL